MGERMTGKCMVANLTTTLTKQVDVLVFKSLPEIGNLLTFDIYTSTRDQGVRKINLHGNLRELTF